MCNPSFDLLAQRLLDLALQDSSAGREDVMLPALKSYLRHLGLEASTHTIAVVLVGPGDIARAHAEDEQITIGELARGVDLLCDLARPVLGRVEEPGR